MSTFQPATPGAETQRDLSAGIASGGSLVEAIGGIAAMVLAIVGLAGFAVFYTTGAAVIAVAVALVFEGVAITSSFTRLPHEAGLVSGGGEVGSGATAEFFAGLAGIVLGILALLGFAPLVLAASAVVVFGSALLLGAGTVSRLGFPSVSTATAAGYAGQMLMRESAIASANSHVFIGIGAIVLGILALVNLAPATLVLVALLALGAVILLSGVAVGSRPLSALWTRSA